MYSLSLINAALLLLILAFIWMMYRFNKLKKQYNVVDLLLGSDDRASVANHIQLAFAALSIWVVIDRELDGKDVETILLGVLGVFVLKQGATQIAETLNKPTEPISTTTTTKTERKEETTVPVKPRPRR